MPKLTVDGEEVEFDPGMTVLQVCEEQGIEIPKFCYHERLSIAGNCRMCLVDMERAPRPVAACSVSAGDGMVIRTNTEEVRKMRRSVMEFLLINHPLDCPVCDQAGECDLQDQAITYGMNEGRFSENKRAVPDKDFGPLVRGVMTRCIHCTRCIRFATEVAGVPQIGGIGRGEHMEVGTYIEGALSSELSGNLVDLCPVGALTSAPYAFTARPWELRKTESIDVMDALGSNIRIDARGAEVMRITPRLNEEVNEEWLSDKGRFSYDALRHQRLDVPYLRGADGKLAQASWQEAFTAIKEKVQGLDGGKIAALAGDQADCESMLLLKELLDSFQSPNRDCRQDGAALDPSCRAGYLFNTTIAGIERADALLLVGANPRLESPVLNARIRKRYLQGAFPAGLVGEKADLTYGYEHLGVGPAVLEAILSGRNSFAQVLNAAKQPMIISGMGALTHPDGHEILGLARRIAESYGMIIPEKNWNGFNVLHTAAGRVGGLDVGFVPAKGGRDTAGIIEGCAKGQIEVLYLLGADEVDMNGLGKTFVIYQGHHGDAGAARADVILPGAAYTEKNATYVNTEGRPQHARLAVFPPGGAREDWAIIRALSEYLGRKAPVDNLDEVRARLAEANPIFAAIDRVQAAEWGDFGGTMGKTGDTPLSSPIKNFYMTDPISRTSPTMSICTQTFVMPQKGKAKTDG